MPDGFSKDPTNYLPHRPPFLFVDEVIELDPGKRVVATFDVRSNETFFLGHFPDHAVMPGVIIMEALAQTGAIAVLALQENRGKIPLFVGADNVRFRGQVRPGNMLRLEVDITENRRIGKGIGKAFVSGKLVCEGEILFMLAPLDMLQS